MNFFLHFKSTFDAFLEVNTMQLGFIKKNAPLPLSLEVSENYPLFLRVTPLLLEESDEVLLPYSTKINWSNNFLEENNQFILVTEYPNQNYELLLLKNSFYKHEIPKVLCQSSYVIKGLNHTATLFFDGIYQLMVQEKELLFTHKIDKKIENVTIEKLKNKDIVLIKGSSETGVYVLILAYLNGAYQILKEATINKLEQSENALTLLFSENDMTGHGIVEDYEILTSALKKKEEYVVYINNKPQSIVLPELIPYAFLEAIKIKNFTLARSYLTDELSASLQDEHLTAYFNDFVDVVPAMYEKDSENKIALIYDGKKRMAKIFRVELEKNKISNFSEC